MKEKGINPLILDAGDLFFSTSSLNDKNKKSELFRAESIIEGYNRIGCDVINVGHYEVLNGLSFLEKVSKKSKAPFISANLRKYNNDDLIFPPYQIIKKDGLEIGVIGVTDNLPDTSNSMKADNYIEAGNKYINKILKQVDLIVMLVNCERGKQQSLVTDFPKADFIVTSGSTNMTRANSPQEANGPLVYSCGKQGKYLISVELEIKDNKEPFVDISAQEKNLKQINKRFERLQKKDPTKPLEEIYADQTNVLKLIDGYKKDLIESENLIGSAINTLKFKTFALNRKVEDNDEILEFVNAAISTCTILNPKINSKQSNSIKKNKIEKSFQNNHSKHDGHNN